MGPVNGVCMLAVLYPMPKLRVRSTAETHLKGLPSSPLTVPFAVIGILSIEDRAGY